MRPHGMRELLALSTLCAGLASAQQYVVFSEANTTNTPSARALASYALQTTTLEETGALGTFVWRFGGALATGAERATDELFMLDMQTMQWRERNDVAGDTPTARRGASLSFAPAASTAFLFGGENAQQTKLGELDALILGSSTSDTPQWQRGALAAGTATPPARTEHTATVVTLHWRAGEPTGLLVFGGAGASGYLADIHEYDIDWRVWRVPADVSGTPPSARKSHAAALLLESTVVIVGGEGSAGYSDDVHLYDTSRNHWSTPDRETTTGSYPPKRAGHVVQVCALRPHATFCCRKVKSRRAGAVPHFCGSPRSRLHVAGGQSGGVHVRRPPVWRGLQRPVVILSDARRRGPRPMDEPDADVRLALRALGPLVTAQHQHAAPLRRLRRARAHHSGHVDDDAGMRLEPHDDGDARIILRRRRLVRRRDGLRVAHPARR